MSHWSYRNESLQDKNRKWHCKLEKEHIIPLPAVLCCVTECKNTYLCVYIHHNYDTEWNSSTSLIHSIEMMFWQSWALHCHKNRNIRKCNNKIRTLQMLNAFSMSQKFLLPRMLPFFFLMLIYLLSSCPKRLLQLYIQQAHYNQKKKEKEKGLFSIP